MNTTSYAEPESKLTTVLGKRALVYLGILVFALALLLIFNTGNASAAGPTYVYEDITSDTTWIEADSPYIVNQSIAVDPGVTLTIDPNVTVMFDSGVGLLVGGTLDAQGTADEPITFTANGSTVWGFWDGISFDETSTGNVMDYVLIEYAYEGINVLNSDLQLSNADIHYTTHGGVWWESTESVLSASMSNVNVSEGDWVGIFLLNHEGSIVADLTDIVVIDNGWGIAFEANHSIEVTLDGIYCDYCWQMPLYFVSYNGDIDATMTDVTCIDSGVQGVYMVASEGAVTATFTDLYIDYVDSNVGIYIECNNTVDLTIDGVFINDPGQESIYVYVYNGDLNIDIADAEFSYVWNGYSVHLQTENGSATVFLTGCTWNNTNDDAIEVLATQDVEVFMADCTFLNVDGDLLYAESTEGGAFVEADGIYADEFWGGDGFDVQCNDTLEFYGSDIWLSNTDWTAFELDSWNGDIILDVEFVEIYNAQDAFVLTAPNGVIDPIIENVIADGLSGYFVLYNAPLVTEIVIEFNDVTVNDTAYVIPAVTLPGDIELILINSAFTNIGSDCFWMFSTNGNITVDMTDSIISVVGGDGIFAWAPNGWVSVTVDPSVIDGCDYGIFVDAVSIPTFDLMETTISNCNVGVLLYADTEDLAINIVDCIFDGNADYAFRADANLGNLMFDMIGTLVNDTDSTGIYLESFDGDVAVSIEASSIVGSNDGVVLVAFDNITVDLLDTTFDNSVGYGLDAEATFGDVILSMMGGMVNNSLDAGIYMWSGDGFVIADFWRVNFGFNFNSIVAETDLDDVDLWVDFCVFTGDLSDSIVVDAGNDSYFELTDTVMNGYEANANGWYFFDEIEYEYDIIDPTPNSTTSDFFVYTFPFDFPFQGMIYTTAYVYENGYISLGGAESFPVDLESASNPAIVPCQQNFIANIDPPLYGYKDYEDRVVFQWDVYVSGENSYLRNVFEVVLYENGDIQFNYAEMESVSHTVYDYGLGTAMGAIDVGEMWMNADPFDNDWTSYYFTATPMSDGVAAWIESENNNTAMIYENTISNYFFGGVNCYANEGWVWMDAVNNSFSNMVYGIQTAALFGWAADNTIWANAQDNDFANIVQMGVVFVSESSQGGVDEIVVVNNTFQDVSMLAIAAVNSLHDSDGNSTLAYSSTKTITDNVGVNSGMIYTATDIYSDNSSLDITVTDLITRNVFTGYPKIYEIGILGDMPLPPMVEGSITSYVYMETYAKESTLTRTADITENTHVPINGGFMAGSSGIFVYDMVFAYGSVIALTSDIEIAGNTLVGELVSFDVGIGAVVYGYVGDGADLTMDVLVDINDNFVECDAEYGNTGVMVDLYLVEFEDGEGAGTLNATVLIWENTIIDFWDGIYVYAYVYMWNFWGDFEATVDTLITQNWIEAYECIYVDLEAQCGFSSYFPSYEEEIWSSVTADFVTTITENDLFADYYAVYLYYYAYAQEDGYGTFANALVDFDNDVIIADNLIESSYYGIVCYGDLYAYYGEAELWSDTLMEIYGNTLVGVEYDGPIASGVAIEVYEYAYAYTNQYEFDDSPVVYDTFVVGIYDNTVENFDDGIGVYADIYTQYGLSYVDAMIEIDIANNEVAVDGYGIYAEVYCYDSQASQGGFSSNATADVFADVVIFSNTISPISDDEEPMDLDYGIYCYASSDTNINDEMWFWIQDNTINGEFSNTYGIYAEAANGANANWMISGNAVDMAYDCIHVVGGWAEIISNTVTNSYDDGISVTLANGYITANTIGDCGYGVYIYSAFDIVVSDNDITTTWDMETWEGILVSSGENLTIENNMIDGFEYGIDLYDAYDSYVTGNTVLNSLYEAVYLYGCENIEFSDNLVQTGYSDGIYVYSSEFITLANNTISDFMYDGIYLYDSDDCVIADNEIFDMGDDGLDIYNCYDIVLYNGVFYDCNYAIEGSSYSMTWIIDGVAEVRNCPVYFEGDVIVVDGGWLNLDFVSSFELADDYYDGIPALVVEEGGLLTATNTEFGAIDGNEWLFDVYGTMEMDNSWIYEAYQLYCGPTSDVTIHASSIWYNHLNGVYIDDCSPVLAFVDIYYNEKAGVYITGENADPEIKDCMISFNERGIYANEASLGQVIDNLIFYNYMTGIYVDSVVGEIHDNILLFNQREIFVMNSVLSIEDNQIGYSYLVEVMSDYWPMLMGELGETSMADWSFDPEDIMSLMTNHIGVYVENSVVECSDNVYGMLSYALYAVESDVLFMDSVEMYDLVLTYFDEYYAMYNITLPIFVYDGIFASDSTIVVADAYIEVLDDAIFLETTNATVDSCELVAGDFDIYAMDGSNVDVIGGELDKVKAEDDTEIDLWYTMTVYTVDPDGNPVDVYVMVFDSVHTYPMAEGNSSDGVFTAQVMAGMWTSSGEDTSMNPYTVIANFDGGNADQTVTVDGDVEMTLQDPGPESPHLGAGFAIAVAVIAGILVVIGLLTLAVRP